MITRVVPLPLPHAFHPSISSYDNDTVTVTTHKERASPSLIHLFSVAFQLLLQHASVPCPTQNPPIILPPFSSFHSSTHFPNPMALILNLLDL